MTPNEVTAYNEMIRRWSAMVRRKLHGSVLRSASHGKEGKVIRGNRSENKLQDSLGFRTYMYYGEVNQVGFRFERHGVFFHKGVGRGYIMSGGTVVLGKHPSNFVKNYAKTNGREASDIVLQGPLKRKPVEWFNPILDQLVPELADKVMQMNGDAAVNATKMRIN